MAPKSKKATSISKKASFKQAPAKPAKEKRGSQTVTAAAAQTTREGSALQPAGTPVRKGRKTDAKPTRRQPSRNCKKIPFGITSSRSAYQDTKSHPKHGKRSSGKANKQVLSPKKSSRERGTTQERPLQLAGKTREQIPSIRSTQREEFRTQPVSQKESQKDNRRIKPATAVWVDQLNLVSPEEVPQQSDPYLNRTPTAVAEEQSRMDSTTPSSSCKDDEISTVKIIKRVKAATARKVSDSKLRIRKIEEKRKPDSKMEHLRSLLKTELPEPSERVITQGEALARNFLEEIGRYTDRRYYALLDSFSYSIDAHKADAGLSTVNTQYFDADLARCQTKVEAVLQRTIMMNVLDRHWLGEHFDWNTEGQWRQPKETLIRPTKEGDEMTLPKPDLMISFTLESFSSGRDRSHPIPDDLEPCIFPDRDQRCFPFLFFEVKKAAADLVAAHRANLNNASQALYNIWQWMKRADQLTEFYEKVRVFTFVFNAQELSVRVHRAELDKDDDGQDALFFVFDIVEEIEKHSYTRDKACLLVSSIMKNYADAELLPILQATFAEVMRQEKAKTPSKRKGDPSGRESPKRTRTSESPIRSTEYSFDAASLISGQFSGISRQTRTISFHQISTSL
ncbi:MAG: hypothetical protein M1821_002610 [Bathelium mastoideum]|nr:MAG: hypothetical protein M1821_002610 [Bathelium mastoideum]